MIKLRGMLFLVVISCSSCGRDIATYSFAGTQWQSHITDPQYCGDVYERQISEAYILFEEHSYREAFEAFRYIGDTRGHPYQARGNLMAGIIQTRWGFESGESWIRAAIKLKPSWEHAHITLVWHYVSMGEDSSAEAYAVSLTQQSFATTNSWNALKEVRAIAKGKKEKAARQERWKILALVLSPVVAVGLLVIAVLLVYDSDINRWLCTKDLEKRLSAIRFDAKLTADQIRAQLLSETAKVKSAQMLQEILLDSHLQTNANSLKGLKGVLDVYRRSLRQVNDLNIDNTKKEELRKELEGFLIQIADGFGQSHVDNQRKDKSR